MVSPEDVLGFWLDEVGPQGWYKASDTLDDTVRERFQSGWENARASSRNMLRGN